MLLNLEFVIEFCTGPVSCPWLPMFVPCPNATPLSSVLNVTLSNKFSLISKSEKTPYVCPSTVTSLNVLLFELTAVDKLFNKIPACVETAAPPAVQVPLILISVNELSLQLTNLIPSLAVCCTNEKPVI